MLFDIQSDRSMRGIRKMYRRITIALFVAGVLVAGYGIFANSTAQASHCRNSNDSATLAANPELLKLGCNEASQPVAVDLEALRQFYAQEWAVEADTTDPSPQVQPVSNPIGVPVTVDLEALRELYELPVTVDREALREFFAQEWTVEADTIDSISSVEPANVVKERTNYSGR
jgi:hypothetical protein